MLLSYKLVSGLGSFDMGRIGDEGAPPRLHLSMDRAEL